MFDDVDAEANAERLWLHTKLCEEWDSEKKKIHDAPEGMVSVVNVYGPK